ncbi:DivIVA domain-containing protein [Diaminobutyricimonas aerilata]|uniref:Cell wall synthesis protein Wag31 n=1 Tax=Diaminobutyricimonas aerilata TaxID=1162967 RepID=A0A2M9CKH5_9MICO|nr:DivIVA domain-containing protein [Diaminobutyricimonas aerilata]PJJ72379.1 DivIVA domain-containing protein [Diaminobutyricimonas aerilata]
MALTPEDVVNKRFQPTKFREGYDQDEVDDFLDEVVVELRRLNQENEELRQRLVASESRINELQRSGGQQAQPAPAAEAAPATPEPVATPTPAPVAAAAPAPAYVAPSADSSFDPSNTNNLLQLARRLHEEHVREGVEKRDALIAEGHATAARVVAEAEAKQRAQLSALEQERAVLEKERDEVERRIEGLKTFEREYRQKLRGYIEGQLRELETAGSAAPAARADQGESTGEQRPAPISAPSGGFGAPPAPPANFSGFGGGS